MRIRSRSVRDDAHSTAVVYGWRNALDKITTIPSPGLSDKVLPSRSRMPSRVDQKRDATQRGFARHRPRNPRNFIGQPGKTQIHRRSGYLLDLSSIASSPLSTWVEFRTCVRKHGDVTATCATSPVGRLLEFSHVVIRRASPASESEKHLSVKRLCTRTCFRPSTSAIQCCVSPTVFATPSYLLERIVCVHRTDRPDQSCPLPRSVLLLIIRPFGWTELKNRDSPTILWVVPVETLTIERCLNR